MRSRIHLIALLGTAVAATSTPAHGMADPVVERVSQQRYRCGGGQTIEAIYYTLDDRSLRFVRLLLPGGRRLTLPQVMSASGERFSADQDVTWWVKGNSGFVQQRNQRGDWTVTLDSCDVQP